MTLKNSIKSCKKLKESIMKKEEENKKKTKSDFIFSFIKSIIII